MPRSNFENNFLALVRAMVSAERMSDAVALVKAMPEGEAKGEGHLLIIAGYLKYDLKEPADDYVSDLPPGNAKDAALSLLVSYGLLHEGLGFFRYVVGLIGRMDHGPLRDGAIDEVVAACARHGEMLNRLSAIALLGDEEKKRQYAESLFQDRLQAKDLPSAAAAAKLLGRKLRPHEKEKFIVIALGGKDLEAAKAALAQCGRDALTAVEIGIIAENAARAGDLDAAADIVKRMEEGKERSEACWAIVRAFEEGKPAIVAFASALLDAIPLLPIAHRAKAYDAMMAVCVKYGMYAVASRVEGASGRKATDDELKAMIAVGCADSGRYDGASVRLAERMTDGPERTALVNSMIPSLVDIGDIGGAEKAAAICGRKLTFEEVRAMAPRVVQRSSGYSETTLRLLALLDGQISDDEARKLVGN